MDANQRMRNLPSVGALLESRAARQARETHGHALVADALRQAVDEIRSAILEGRDLPENLEQAVLSHAETLLARTRRSGLRRVINATGVIVHTNLGRSILSEEAARAVYDISRSYNNLEADLEQGRRSSRHVHIADRLKSVIGAPAGAVFNNNAATIMLALAATSQGREVIISRGELIEIGGSFRMPEVIEQSGCILREVGATNRTHVEDYRRAINENTAAIVRAHPSNYRIVGFTKTPGNDELADLAHEHGIHMIEDLGSGCLIDLEPYGVGSEPTVQQAIQAGVDIITFSGDKLLGGPQCGIAVGKPELIEMMKKHPLARAVRVGKMTIAALAATLDLLRDPELAVTRIPTLRAATEPTDVVKSRAQAIADGILAQVHKGKAEVTVVVDNSARVGGGSLPEEGLETASVHIALADEERSANDLARDLRMGDPAIYSRVGEGALILDARTIQPGEVEETIAIAVSVIRGTAV